MTTLDKYLILSSCPHCSVDQPSLVQNTRIETLDYRGGNHREWGIYSCARCGGVTTAWAYKGKKTVQKIYPQPIQIDEALPERARNYLEQAINSINSPSGAIMLCACSVDSMLKAKGYSSDSLYSRIKKAAQNHLITSEMEKWAHEVRLDANNERHADETLPLPTSDDARRVIDFVQSLGMFLFVLPARIQQGIENSSQ